MSTEMGKVLETYAKVIRKGSIPIDQLRLVYKGEYIEPDQTPEMIGLQEDDIVYCEWHDVWEMDQQ